MSGPEGMMTEGAKKYFRIKDVGAESTDDSSRQKQNIDKSYKKAYNCMIKLK